MSYIPYGSHNGRYYFTVCVLPIPSDARRGSRLATHRPFRESPQSLPTGEIAHEGRSLGFPVCGRCSVTSMTRFRSSSINWRSRPLSSYGHAHHWWAECRRDTQGYVQFVRGVVEHPVPASLCRSAPVRWFALFGMTRCCPL